MVFENEFEFKGIVIGMILGDGSLGLPCKNESINARLSISHSQKNNDYVEWKKKILEHKTSVRSDTYIGGYSNNTFSRITTKCHPLYTKLYKRIYHLGRKTTDEHCLKLLNDVGLAILYMDDGSISNSNGSVEINKNCFNYAEQLMLQKCFKLKWDLNWNIHRKGIYYRLYLKHKDVPKFFDIINKTIDLIPSMKYKTLTEHNYR